MLRPTLTQYNVLFENKPAVRGRVLRLLTKEKVHPRSMIVAADGDTATVQFLAYKSPELREKLERAAGGPVREDQVFQLEMPNRPSELNRLVDSLADRGIRIISLYTTVEDGRLRVVLAVDQPANAVALAEKLGFVADYAVFDVRH